MGTDLIVQQANGHCPGCSAPIGWTGPTVCAYCGISLIGPEAAELYWITTELARLDDTRGRLMVRRDFLVAELIRQRERAEHEAAAGAQPVAPGPSAADPAMAAAGPGPGGAVPGGAVPGQAVPVRAARPEMSRRSVANLLLAVGGLLLAIAAAAFTVANWGAIGPAGRGAILLALAVLALAVPWPLSRRGLTATAESIAGFGLALSVADTYLARSVVGGSARISVGFAAVAVTVLAAAWAAYGSVAPVRGPRPAAIVLAQLCLPLAVAANTGSAGALALAALVTAGADLALAAYAGSRRSRIECRTALAAAVVSWLAGIAIAAIGAAKGPAVGESVLLAVAFIAAAAVGLGLSVRRVPASEPAGTPAGGPASESASVPAGVPASQGTPASRGTPAASAAPDASVLARVLSGILLAVGIALPAAAVLPDRWVVGDFALAAALVVACGRWLASRARLAGSDQAAQVAQAAQGAGLAAHPVTAQPGGAQPGGAQPGAEASQAVVPDAPPVPARSGDALAGRAPGRRLAAEMARQIATGGFGVLGGAGLWVTPAALFGLLDPIANVNQIWAGHPAARPVHGLAATVAVPAVLLLVAAACWLGTARPAQARPLALAIAALAAGSAPVAFGLPGLAGLILLTVLAALAAGVSVTVADLPLARTASWVWVVLSGCAAAASLTTPAQTITELAVIAVICAAAAWRASSGLPVVLATAQTVAASAGLACAVPLAIYRPHSRSGEQVAAFAVLGVAIAAIGGGTLLRRARPRHALVLDVAAVPVVVLAALLAGRRADTFSVLASAVALLAATTAWLRDAPARLVALGTAGLAVVAALAPQLMRLAAATVEPYRQFRHPWTSLPAVHGVLGQPRELRFAVIVLVTCGVAAVVGCGAWRGREGTLRALAVTLPVAAAPAGMAAGLTPGWTAALLLAFTLLLTGWAAVSSSLAPAGAALAAAWLTLPWALSSAPATLTALGCLTAGYVLTAWLARQPGVRFWSAAAAVVTAGALAGSSAAAAGWPRWLAGLTVLAVAASAQYAAARLDRASLAARGEQPVPLPLHLAVEVAGWLIALAGLALTADRVVHAGSGLAAAAALCLAVSLRPGRQPLLWAGLALAEAALCLWLVWAGVHAPEPYALPASAILILAGWRRSRRVPQTSSWLAYWPGLAIALLPSLVAAWTDPGWLRPLLLGLAATAITLAGARARLMAPLLTGATVALLDAGRQLAPAIAKLAGEVPRWVPIALLGLLLLTAGATYEARLKDLGKLRNALRRMH